MTATVLQNRALEIANRCERVGRVISKRAETIARRRRALRAINVVVGAVAAIVTLSEPIAKRLGGSVIDAIALIAAAVLMVDGILPSLMKEESPDRLRDYGFYIHLYAGVIRNALIEEGVTDVQRRTRIIVLLEFAEMNLSDACSKFDYLFEVAEGPNQAPGPTRTSVTSPTAHEPRQL